MAPHVEASAHTDIDFDCARFLACVQSVPVMSQSGLEQLALQPATALYESRLETVSAQEDVLKQLATLESGMLLACMLFMHVCCFTA